MNAAEVFNRYRHGAVADGQDPDASSGADLGNGPGIQKWRYSPLTSPAPAVRRRSPLRARLIASEGDSVTTYGEPWNVN